MGVEMVIRAPEMPSAVHCQNRAERLRFALLLTPDPAAAARLRSFVENYRVLAARADKKIASPPSGSVEQVHAITKRSQRKRLSGHVS